MTDTSKFVPRATQIGGLMCFAGLLALAAGMMLAPYDVAIQHQADASLPEGSPWAGLVYITGFALFVVGLIVTVVSFRRRANERGIATREDLAPLVESRPLPFSVCASCRIVIDEPNAFNCPRCDSLEHCIRVERDDERSMALAAIPPAAN